MSHHLLGVVSHHLLGVVFHLLGVVFHLLGVVVYHLLGVEFRLRPPEPFVGAVLVPDGCSPWPLTCQYHLLELAQQGAFVALPLGPLAVPESELHLPVRPHPVGQPLLFQ